MKFTKQEIALCKEIVKYHQKPVGYGDWYCVEMGKQLSPPYLWKNEQKVNFKAFPDNNVIPLWALEDCLEFLVKKKKRNHFSLVKALSATGKGEWECFTEEEGGYWTDTPLEACLKAVLAVLAERK